MIGMRIAAPTKVNFKLDSGAAACQIVTDGGIILGHKLMTKPVKAKKTKAIAAALAQVQAI